MYQMYEGKVTPFHCFTAFWEEILKTIETIISGDHLMNPVFLNSRTLPDMICVFCILRN